MSDLVSIVMPCYNAKAFISEAIESVLRQTYTNWELLIVDDRSTDGSQAIAKGYASRDHRIKLLRLDENGGVSHARNVATRQARGRFLAFLDSDDVWLPEKLERQVHHAEASGARLVYCSYRKMSESGRLGGVVRVPSCVSYTGLLKTNSIACLTAVYDAGSIGKFYFDESLSTNEDYVLWLTMLKNGTTAHGLEEPLAHYRVRAQSRSSNKLRTARDQWMIYRRIESLSPIKSLYYFAHYAFHGVRKAVV